MKKLFLFLFFLQIGMSLHSQSRAIELKIYCFGNIEHNLISKLSAQSKLELEKILQENNVDTSSLYRIKYEEVFSKYTTEKYLSSHSYKYINWRKQNNSIKIEEYIGLNGFSVGNPNKLLMLYLTNNNGVESLKFYILN
jgi:hypothetical protein